ncbi:hypothetical protein EJ03DRAFT_204718 [Teratosphaeria nubilosa]|uniref:Structure-specific endonuclease subunit SLX4 n=1 Tax=Teratosphaeria nubilosa TaxID=161662 RepID=A0A6G1KZB0_9PEZI|nr:hypothetical protein EJ03DRAFT_204718 [Teratosphaeria nubilosa]
MSDDDSAFQAFIGGFSLAKPSLSPRRSVPMTTTTTKRRRIELADAATVPLTSMKAPKRAKSPAKKPQTITDRATKAFQALPVTDDSVSKFFTTASTTAACPDQQKPKRKRAKKATSTKPPPPVLYSPEKALLQAESQHFLFATSSQLAVEDSPKLIKETVAAVEASEASFSVQLSTKVSLQPAEKQHWGSSRRDFNGGMLRDTSGLRRTAPAPKVPVRQAKKDEGWTVLSSSSPPSAAPPRLAAPAEMPLQQKDSNVRLPTSVSPEKPVLKRGRPPKKQQQTSAESAFVNIDDISDPESPATPSPPRRRASASPNPPPTLHLSPSKSQNTTTNSTDALAAAAQLKAQDGQWSSVSKQLFPLITNTLKAMPRSTDPEKPSWHQKILLYDPIVLEDITADLNEKGLRVSIRRRKTKAAARKGKKAARKGAELITDRGEGVVMAGEQAGEAEIESVNEELQPWMVQKWCEENSVCCLWREGLRGGVRTRY